MGHAASVPFFRHRPTRPGGIAMIQTLVLSSILLAVPAQAGGRGSSMLGGKAAAKVEAAEGSAEALAKYNELKAKTPRTAAAQSKLATWCEEHGLKAESYVHYAEVVRLDPRREAAWRKLGYRKYGNRWMTDAQIAAVEDQKKSERIWLPQVKKIHKDIHGSNGAKKRDLARAAFEAIRDEKAISSLYREFGGSPTDQVLLIQALDRIDTPLATKVLAMLAVYGQTPEVRRRATELLRGRPSQDYLELLVDLMVDPFKYEVKPVGGPGSPGILFVEGEKFNVARFYAPPPPPNVVPQPGDIITYDRFGTPGILRHVVDMKGVPGSSTLAYQYNGELPVHRAPDEDGGPESGRRGGGPARGGRGGGEVDQRRPQALLRAGHRGRRLRDGQGQGPHTQGMARGREGRKGGEEIW